MTIQLYRIQAAANDEKYFVIFYQTVRGIKISLTKNEKNGTLFNLDQIVEFIPKLNDQIKNGYTFSQFDTNIKYNEESEEFVE